MIWSGVRVLLHFISVRKSTPLQTRKIACIFMFEKVVFIFANIFVNITVQMYPCSEGTDTGSPAL